jgi:DNA helicase II / ATP-dependent DNA helicase PcrA
MINNQHYDGFTESQKKAVFHKDGPLLVLAGPGSGKTRVITYRIATLIETGIAPYHICAITFTNKAAQEMRERAVTLGASGGACISTFHALCVRILRQYAEHAGIRKGFTIYDPADQKKCMKEAIKDCELDSTNFAPAKLLNAVSTLKNRLTSVTAFEAEAYDYFSKSLSRAYKRYQEILTDRNALDFDDLLVKTAFLLEGNQQVCTELARRFQYLLVDEYQDTNHAQYRIAKALAVHHDNIMVTGDPDQSIYRWRGADIKNIMAFEKDWPDAVVVKLEENFRSSATILKVADSLIGHNRNRKQKALVPTKPGGLPVKINGYEDEQQEAESVAIEIKRLMGEGVSLNKMAIFYRINAMSRTLEESLIRQQIPYQIVRGVEFYGRKEIKDMLAYLKVLINPDDEVSLLRIINTPARGIGKVTMDKIKMWAVHQGMSLYAALGQVERIDTLTKSPKGKVLAFFHMMEQFKPDIEVSVAQLAERIIAESGMEHAYINLGADGKDALDNLSELVNSAARHDEQTDETSLEDYLQLISLFSDADAYDEDSKRVALMTLHAAKGLEFPHVFVVGLEEGILPHERSADEDDELEEERRLFFVGITRAEKDLNISYARYRTVHGQTMRSIPSTFLRELGLGFAGSANRRQENRPLASATPAVKTKSKAKAPYSSGELVRHKKFGLGRVQNYTDMGENSIVTVDFNNGQTKNLMIKYAKLSKMG